MCVFSVHVCLPAYKVSVYHMYAGVHRGQKRVLDPLETELQVFGCWELILGSAEVTCTEPSLQTLYILLKSYDGLLDSSHCGCWTL